MARNKWVECTCDNCQNVIHVKEGFVNEQLRDYGFIVSKFGDFCSIECYNEFLKKNKDKNGK